HVTNTYQAAMALCLKGLGIARFPYYVAAEEILRGNLVQLFPKYQITTHPLYLAYLKNEYPSHKHKIVKAEIINWFKGRPEYFV
ncbi:MAG: LysR substrate-binding domain-containing protein, partial [Pseudobdellovibrionaceae bacterium]